MDKIIDHFGDTMIQLSKESHTKTLSISAQIDRAENSNKITNLKHKYIEEYDHLKELRDTLTTITELNDVLTTTIELMIQRKHLTEYQEDALYLLLKSMENKWNSKFYVLLFRIKLDALIQS